MTQHTQRPALIIGGAGFVGINLAFRLLGSDKPVILFDNLSRCGVERNVRALRSTYGDAFRLIDADIRDAALVSNAMDGVDQVFHFAAQVAVTTSLENPRHDFEVNALGTLNVLEAMRALPDPPALVFTSTNKVYGSLPDVALRQNGRRYEPVDENLRSHGINETRPLDFHSPYGCSKGAADQYVIDYARTFDLPATVFRMSCIYGPHQHGNEDQGWVAHFLLRALAGQPITIYGDGRQVRDILFVRDLIDALLLAHQHIDTLAGRAFNIGGGTANTVSLLELIDLIGELHGQRPLVDFAPTRPGDQRFYVSDTGAFEAATGWHPRTSIAAGVQYLYTWLLQASKATPVQPLAQELVR